VRRKQESPAVQRAASFRESGARSSASRAAA